MKIIYNSLGSYYTATYESQDRTYVVCHQDREMAMIILFKEIMGLLK